MTAQSGQLRRLAWALQDEPGLLTGAGARAPAPSVLRLIGRLREAGATGIVAPPCPRCGRVIYLHRRIEGQWCCRNCEARSRSQPCAQCGANRQVAARDEHGQPLCSQCLIADPANQETCAGCGRRRPVNVRAPSGPLCANCRPWKTLTCGICGRKAPCAISEATGKPWCRACKKRWIRCARCGQAGPVRGGTPGEPLCSACTRPDPGFWRSCPDCGQPGRIHASRCARCAVKQRLRGLLGNQDGEIRPQLQALYHALATADRPDTVAAWLAKSAAPAILNSLDPGQQLTHQVLDELPPGKTVEHLRSVLVDTGTLPPRDEQMTRLNHWISHVIGERPDPGQQQLLHRYAVWHVMRRLRARLGGTHATNGQVRAAQRVVKAATALLDWLTARDLTLATARQGDLDAWLASAQASHRTDAGNFVRWARKQKLTSMDFAATRWGGPAGVIDTETRWQQARWLLHDDTLKPEDRVAGLLVVLYAQTAATVSRLTTGHIQASGNTVQIRLGREPVVLPEPLDALILQARRHPARPCRHRRPGNLPLAVPRRAARTPDQRLPARRTSPPARHPLRAVPLRRAVPARHRPARRAARTDARHPHHRRRRMAARLGRGLDGLRSRRQPPQHRPRPARGRHPAHHNLKKHSDSCDIRRRQRP